MVKQLKITSFFQDQKPSLSKSPSKPEEKGEKEKKQQQGDDLDIENRPLEESKELPKEAIKPAKVKEEKVIETLEIIDDSDVDDVNDKKPVSDDDYDSDEVQKPRNKSKRSAESAWLEDTPTGKGTQKRNKPDDRDDVEDGIIGMKVRSPTNGRQE